MVSTRILAVNIKVYLHQLSMEPQISSILIVVVLIAANGTEIGFNFHVIGALVQISLVLVLVWQLKLYFP